MGTRPAAQPAGKHKLSNVSRPVTTPIRRQYLDVKKRYPHAIVFFRLGDFYETFDDDARLVAKELAITLTSKPMGKNLRVPLAGVPYHSLDGHLAKLLGRGYKVAICDQMEDPHASNVIEKRGVTEIVTPGTATNEKLLEHGTNNFLSAVHFADNRYALSFLAISTGEFFVA